ncbi:MAG: hypothetical protein A2Y77_17195 [Planctomycetes bacterium RBG_13_62_9]|nr:MAG: hypothetical protein A2Y77_17195 [Planctomycetes bacterium RBG_13_62_9]
MVHKDEYISAHPDLHTGMDAYSVDGEKLGKVEYLDEDSITIEKGWFFPKDFTIRYDDVMDVAEDRITVNRSRADLEEWRSEGYTGWEEYDRTEGAEETTAAAEETRIPIREEELDVQRRRREGEVRLRKVVHTETKHMEVPVEKEEVIVERVPADETAEAGGEAFREEETRIPVGEEEVEVTKRPVIKEEVRARKQARTERRDVSAEVRKEDVEVEQDRPGRRGKK